MRLRTKVELGGIAILLAVLAFLTNPHCDIDWYTVTVTDKQIKRIGGRDVYLVFTILDDGSPRVFKNTDSRLYLKFNSSDMNALLRVDHKYRLKTVGWRWGVKSWYENILKVVPLQTVEPPKAAADTSRAGR